MDFDKILNTYMADSVRLFSLSTPLDDDIVFYGNKSSVIKQIGNAVPPMLAYYLAKVILKVSCDDKYRRIHK